MNSLFYSFYSSLFAAYSSFAIAGELINTAGEQSGHHRKRLFRRSPRSRDMVSSLLCGLNLKVVRSLQFWLLVWVGGLFVFLFNFRFNFI